MLSLDHAGAEQNVPDNLIILNSHQGCDHQSFVPQPVHELRFEVAAECCTNDCLDLIVVGGFFFTNVEH